MRTGSFVAILVLLSSCRTTSPAANESAPEVGTAPARSELEDAGAPPIESAASAPTSIPQLVASAIGGSKFHVVSEAFHGRDGDDSYCDRLRIALDQKPLSELSLRTEAKLAPHVHLDDDAQQVICAAALGAKGDDDLRECHVTVTSRTGAVSRVTVNAIYEFATMQSRAQNTLTLDGSIRVDDITHAIVASHFVGRAIHEARSPCEKLCEHPDRCPFDRHVSGCSASCYCPFTECGRSTVETTFGAANP